MVDEQHRFGVAQRMELGAKGEAADVLVMTATPIPRSLALATHGDMDVSVLDEKPAGRKPIRTAMVSSERLDEVVDHLAQGRGRGAAGLLGLPPGRGIRSGGLRQRRRTLPRICGPLWATGWASCMARCHPPRKDAAMARFVAGETSVLVATTVIEVGVNVPNATIMVIEQAESFGLAQLASVAGQGRAGRGGLDLSSDVSRAAE